MNIRELTAIPLALDERRVASLQGLLDQRADLDGSELASVLGLGARRPEAQGAGVAVLPLFGLVTPRDSFFGTSCEGFAQRFDELMANAEVGTIVLHVDSPGGNVQLVPETAQKVFEARGRGKRLIAVADGFMASAAYWIGSACDEIVATPSADVGSIGVFMIHTEVSQLEADAGVRRSIIRAGRYKIEANPFEPLPEDARAHLQQGVDDYYDLFVAAVARHRRVRESAVREGLGRGRALTARRAVAAGLADRVATLDQVLEELGVRRSRRGARVAGPLELVACAPAPTPAITAGPVAPPVVAESTPAPTIVIPDTPEPAPAGESTTMPDRPYSLIGAVLGQDAELAVSDDLVAHGALRRHGGVLVPAEHLLAPQAGLETGVATAGQELVFTFPGPIGPALRPIPRVQAMGATILGGLRQGLLRLIRVTDGGVVTWVPETPGADITFDDLAFGAETVSLFTGGLGIAWSRLLESTGPETAGLIEREIRAAAATAIDIAAIDGQGAASDQPEGLLVRSDIPTQSLGAPDGGAPTYAAAVAMERAAAEADVEEGRTGWLTTPGVRAKLRQTEELSGGGIPVWRNGRILDHRAAVSQAVPADLTKGSGTNLHGIVYSAEWSSLVVHVQSIELVVDRITRIRQGIVEGMLWLQVGVGVIHPSAFVRAVDANVT